MASINMSIRTDSELKAQAEQVLSQLGMNMTGTINMFLQQIVRDRAVPLSLSLSSEQSLYADLLKARTEREQGVEYLSSSRRRLNPPSPNRKTSWWKRISHPPMCRRSWKPL